MSLEAQDNTWYSTHSRTRTPTHRTDLLTLRVAQYSVLCIKAMVGLLTVVAVLSPDHTLVHLAQILWCETSSDLTADSAQPRICVLHYKSKRQEVEVLRVCGRMARQL